MKYKVKCVNDSLHFQVLLANFYLEKFSKTRKVHTYNLLILCYLTGFHVPKQVFEKFRKFYNSNTVGHQNSPKASKNFEITVLLTIQKILFLGKKYSTLNIRVPLYFLRTRRKRQNAFFCSNNNKFNKRSEIRSNTTTNSFCAPKKYNVALPTKIRKKIGNNLCKDNRILIF